MPGGRKIMADTTITELKQKIAQAHQVIAHLMDKAAFNGAEAHRALDYFGGDTFDRNFLPWPHHGDEGLRPDELNAANDD
jgi:catalase (peroxidase I)